MRKAALIALATFAAVALAAWLSYWTLAFGPGPVYESPEEHFKYGSIGTEYDTGVPYRLWQALPALCGGQRSVREVYDTLGFLWEDGHDLPVGFSKRTVWGVPSVGINCAFCHTARYRKTPEDTPNLVLAGPGNLVDTQRYIRLLLDCARDPSFTPDRVLDAMRTIAPVSSLEAMAVRAAIVPLARQMAHAQAPDHEWMASRPAWGPGRIDPFNPVKFRLLRLPPDDTIGNSDNAAIWNMKRRSGMALHSDGLNSSLREVVLSSALGDGANRQVIDLPSLARIEAFITERQPPPFPFPIDPALAGAGRTVFAAHCAACHAAGGARTGTVIPIEEIGTDRHRLDMWTAETARAYNAFTAGYPWALTGFRKTDGYVAAPLDGVWLRAPYLHNGSVPYLGELLEAAERRTRVFYRGYDVYDAARLGFFSTGGEAERHGVRQDADAPGNGNGGHLFGVGLPADEKRALLEFLKTL